MTKRLALLITLSLAFSGPVFACACEAPEQELETHVSSLFNANTIVGVFAVDGFRLDDGRWAILGPRHSFKGSASKLLVRMPPRFFKTDCDVHLRKGDLLLVYAKSQEPMHLSMCSQTGHLMSRFSHVPVLFGLSASAPRP